MDLFYESTQLQRKHRIHYHAFMRDIHSMLKKKEDIKDMAQTYLEGVHLLCLDEFQVVVLITIGTSLVDWLGH